MKKTFLGAVLLALCFMFMTSTASATTCGTVLASGPVNVNAGPPAGGAAIGTLANPNPTSINCTVGPLDFGNFAYNSSTPLLTPEVDLKACESTDAGCTPGPASTYGITLNPNLNAPPTEDIALMFEITSSAPIVSVTLVNSGSTVAVVQELVCDGAGLNGGNTAAGELNNGTCVDAPLQNFSGAAQTSQTLTLATPSNTIWVWKDVKVSGSGALSSFQQAFTVNTVPEPATMALAGAALLGLGLLRRRKQA